jgi:hypothetical protein
MLPVQDLLTPENNGTNAADGPTQNQAAVPTNVTSQVQTQITLRGEKS